MTTGQIFTQSEILIMGMIELNNPDFLNAKVYLFDSQVYFLNHFRRIN